MFKAILKRAIVAILTVEAKLVLKKYKPRIIAVTGSVGKTSTKDAIFSALSKKMYVRKSEKSFNSEIGVPLTILGRPNAWSSVRLWLSNIIAGALLIIYESRYPELLILEVGADRPGDIKKICRWLTPDVLVVTQFAPIPVHVEFFGTPESLFEEKAELVKVLKKEGLLVLCADDHAVRTLASRTAARSLTFGFSKNADVVGMKETAVFSRSRKNRQLLGMRFHLRHDENDCTLEVQGSIGRGTLYAALAAAGVGVGLGLTLNEICESLSKHEGPNGRMKVIEGKSGTVIIDDSYNSSPIAAREAIDALAKLKIAGKKIAVLADMLELGKYSISEHKEIGKHAALSGIDMLVTVGVRSRDTAAGAREASMPADRVYEFEEGKGALEFLIERIQSGDAILVKGSQGMRMERVVEGLMAHPEEKTRLLVRQDEEWLSRI